MKCAVERAIHGVETVHAFDGLALLFRRGEMHGDVDSANHQDSIFLFHFAADVGGEFSVASIDLARFQRTSKRSHHSTGGGGDYVINCRRVRFF